MKIVVQRVKDAKVEVEGEITGKIEAGLLLLVCLEKGDNIETIEKAYKKVLALRIFEDEDGKMNKNIQDMGGSILSISQFTLSWDGKKGNRPSFENSMVPDQARLNFAIFNKKLRDSDIEVAEEDLANQCKLAY